MIPTVLLLGALAATLRRGFLVVPVVFVAWPSLLLATDVDSGLEFFVVAGLLGAANALVGYLVGRGVAITFRAASQLLGSS